MLESNKLATIPGVGAVVTTLIGIVVATGIITPEQGSILSANVVPVIGGIIAIVGVFTAWFLPKPKPPLPDLATRDPFGNRG